MGEAALGDKVSYLVSFSAGFLTFLSPCLLPLIPSYVIYITGVSFEELAGGQKRSAARWKAISHSLFFVAGFSLVFVALGLTATLVGKLLFKYQAALRIGGGILIVLFGLELMGVLRLGIFGREKGLGYSAKGAGYVRSLLIGMAFAAAWTPCAGPILGSILVLAGTGADLAKGARLLVVYSMGMAVPFLVSSAVLGSFLEYLKKAQRLIRYVNLISGTLLVVVGFALAMNYFQATSVSALKIFSEPK